MLEYWQIDAQYPYLHYFLTQTSIAFKDKIGWHVKSNFKYWYDYYYIT